MVICCDVFLHVVLLWCSESVSSIFQRANRRVDQQYRRKAWIQLCKAVSAKHLNHRRALEYAHSSLHFAEDAYMNKDSRQSF